ncbi:MAG: C4-dicarboxylic acid transporter DauA [Planctomycetes bacterium]|nr:C4-dicarboxylic acid transporter DauA [Planctomycetota bacterium]
MHDAPRLPRPASALRQVLRDGYTFAMFRADVLAGLVVGIVALPLSMALAIATGMPPQNGIYTAIVAGGAIAFVGGSRVQVSGPTAAFVAVLLPITARHGPGGLMLATLMAGVILTLMGLARLGRLIQFVPYPVVTGFTAGIGLVIATGQVKDLLGLEGVVQHPHFHETVDELARHLDTWNSPDLVVGIVTLALLVWIPRIVKRVPAPLIAIGGVAVAAAWVRTTWPELRIVTIADRFSYVVDGRSVPGIPPWLPGFAMPWDVVGIDGKPVGLHWALLRDLIPSALTIAFSGAIESLLSAVASDAMSGHKHDPDAELLAQGTGNVLAPFFGGFAATGAIARTATNVRAGAASPIAAITHAAFLLVAVLVLSPLLGELPLASMAALLLLVAWRMSDLRHVRHILKSAPTSDTIVLLTCFGLTVAFDMVVGVTAGVLLASLLFMRRIAEMTGARLVRHGRTGTPLETPPGVMVYEIDGPLFFGAAEKAMAALQSIHKEAKALVLNLEGVPVIDATGIVNLRSVLDRLASSTIPVVLTHVHAKVAPSLTKAGILDDGRTMFVRSDLEAGIELATSLAGPAGAQENASS